jgi:hypothetical protein
MAPEQLRGEPQDHRTDIFAAGLVLWELLTGQSLFGAPSYDETVIKVLRRRIPPPSTLGAPAALDDLCLRALCRAPDGRFASATEMGKLLSEIATAQGLLATRDDSARWVQRQAGETLADRRRRANAVFSKPAAAAPDPAPPSPAATIVMADPLAGGRDGDGHAVRRPAAPTVVMSPVAPTRSPPARSDSSDFKLPRAVSRTKLLAVAGTLLAASLSYWVYAGYIHGSRATNAQRAGSPAGAGASAAAESSAMPKPGESKPVEHKQLEAKR